MKNTRKTVVLLLAACLLFNLFSYVSAETFSENAAQPEEVVRVEEVESLRETNSETYLMSDGTYECVVYAENKYYLDENEVLQPIDNAIVAASGGANLLSTQYTNTANAFDVTFSGSGTPEISISYGDAGITFIPVNATGSGNMHMTASASAIAIGAVQDCPTLSELTATGSNTATYADAFGTADLVYVLDSDALKEYIVLEDSAAPNSFNFLFTLDGVTLQETDSGAAFLNTDGEAVFHMGGLFAVDANGVPTDALTYTFQTVKNNIVGVTITLDPEYLAAADRAFPVVIDPTVTISSSSTADACVCEKYPTTNYYMAAQLRTGYDTDYLRRRSYIRFSIPDSIEVGSVINAYLDVEKISGVAPTIRAYRVTGSWSSSTITWNNKPGYTTTHQSTQSAQLSSGSSWYRMDVTSIVNGWVNGNYSNYGFALVDSIENDANHWTTLYSSDANSPHKPELIISYSGSDIITPPPYEPECTSLAINNCTAYMEVGQTYSFSADTSPTGVTVTWESSDTNVATVSGTGVVTARGSGFTTITARSGEKSDSRRVEVAPRGGYPYTITVSNYYDNGFSNDYSSIQAANNNAAERLAKIFLLDLDSNYYSYTSLADSCKNNRHPETDCPMSIPCYFSQALREQFVIDKGVGTDLLPKVLWSSHERKYGDSSNSDPWSFTIVILPMNHSDDYQFMHELAHQLGAHDHYCIRDGNGVCYNEYCCAHGENMSDSEACMMYNGKNFYSASDQTLFCDVCKNLIDAHLRDHH